MDLHKTLHRSLHEELHKELHRHLHEGLHGVTFCVNPFIGFCTSPQFHRSSQVIPLPAYGYFSYFFLCHHDLQVSASQTGNRFMTQYSTVIVLYLYEMSSS